MKTTAGKDKDATTPISEITDSAMKNYEQAVRTSLKLQEEAGRWWSSVMNQTAFTQDWQKRFMDMSGMATNWMPVAQKRVEEMMELMEKNSRTGTELMKKAVDAVQTPGVSESQAKWMDFWTSSMGAVRFNAEAVTQIGTKTLDCWIDLIRKNSEMSEVRMPKSA